MSLCFSFFDRGSVRVLAFWFVGLLAFCARGAAATDSSAAPVATASESVTCPACRGDVACRAKGCKEGKVSCPATCLKLDAPGWIKKKIEGYPDDNIWMVFPIKLPGDTRIQYYSQHHAGELIEYEKGIPVNRGRCPTCEGTSRVECATCKGSGKCAICGGAGKFVRGETLFTLTDVQGRSLEAVVKARTAAAVTVLRLADQKTFDIPLANLSAETLARLDSRFPAAP